MSRSMAARTCEPGLMVCRTEATLWAEGRLSIAQLNSWDGRGLGEQPGRRADLLACRRHHPVTAQAYQEVLSEIDLAAMHHFVEAGGTLFTTDWALRHVIEPAWWTPAATRMRWVPLLVGVLREAERRPGVAALARVLDPFAEHCRRRLEARLERRREADDWSIAFDGGCGCGDCQTLATFLEDPAERRRDWPLAKRRRQHIHHTLDARELPIRHQTRRTGSPYVLVLTKTDAVFDRDADERRRATDDLAWLDARWS